MKIFSNYLKREFEVIANEVLENGRTMQVISHASLENIVHSLENVTYDYDVTACGTEYALVKCTISDGNRRVVSIGESTPKSLTTEIAEMYPATMACNRALDRAVIRFLDLPGKAYSNAEIDVSTLSSSPAPEQESGVSVEEVTEEVIEDEAPVVSEAPVTETVEEESPITEAPVAVEEPVPEVAEEKPVEAPTTEPTPSGSDGSVMVDIGKYKNDPKSIDDIIASGDEKWLAWVVDEKGGIPYFSKNKTKHEQLNAICRVLGVPEINFNK